MNLKYILITDKIELCAYKEQILQLFQKCFGKNLQERIWEWAHIENPLGPPIVSLCFNNDLQLIGHYAVIPIALRVEGQAINSCLSMTTMVDVDYRKYGLFIEQANQVYNQARCMGFQIVIGFPNNNSAPGFRKRLGWCIDDKDYVAAVTCQQLSASVLFKEHLNIESAIGIDLDNNEFRRWRLSKPAVEYHDKKNLIFKFFDKGADIVFIKNGFEEYLEDGKIYNILIDSKVEEFKNNSLFEYRFGYKALTESMRNPIFKKDLLLSDIF